MNISSASLYLHSVKFCCVFTSNCLLTLRRFYSWSSFVTLGLQFVSLKYGLRNKDQNLFITFQKSTSALIYIFTFEFNYFVICNDCIWNCSSIRSSEDQQLHMPMDLGQHWKIIMIYFDQVYILLQIFLRNIRDFPSNSRSLQVCKNRLKHTQLFNLTDNFYYKTKVRWQICEYVVRSLYWTVVLKWAWHQPTLIKFSMTLEFAAFQNRLKGSSEFALLHLQIRRRAFFSPIYEFHWCIYFDLCCLNWIQFGATRSVGPKFFNKKYWTTTMTEKERKKRRNEKKAHTHVIQNNKIWYLNFIWFKL